MLVKSGASPTARALVALELVQNSPGITADRRGDKLGVSERAARRYIDILREAGIPIESVWAPFGGYRIGRDLPAGALAAITGDGCCSTSRPGGAVCLVGRKHDLGA